MDTIKNVELKSWLHIFGYVINLDFFVVFEHESH